MRDDWGCRIGREGGSGAPTNRPLRPRPSWTFAIIHIMQTLLSSPSSAFLSALGAPHAPGATPSWFLLVGFTLEREEDLATLQKELAPFVAYLKAHEPTTKSYRLLKSDKDPLRCAMTERYEDKEHAFLQVHRSSDAKHQWKASLEQLNLQVSGHSYDELAGFMRPPGWVQTSWAQAAHDGAWCLVVALTFDSEAKVRAEPRVRGECRGSHLLVW